MQHQDNAVNVLNVWLLIMSYNVVARMDSLVIHFQAAHFHCNAAIHCVNVMNLDNIVPKAVQLIRNALADKCVAMANAERDVIQDRVLKVNYVKMELVLLAVEIIWIVRMTDHV